MLTDTNYVARTLLSAAPRLVSALRSCILALFIGAALAFPAAAQEKYESVWPEHVSRVWIGPDFWANRLQDWRIRLGRLECTQSETRMPMRTAHLLTAELTRGAGDFNVRVRLGMLEKGHQADGESWSGFLIGAGHGKLDHRAASLIHHYGGEGGGLIAALDDRGQLVFRNNEQDKPAGEYPLVEAATEGDPIERGIWEDLELALSGRPAADGNYRLTLSLRDVVRDDVVATSSLSNFSEERLRGNIALVSHGGREGRRRGARHSFSKASSAHPAFTAPGRYCADRP